MSQFIKSSGSQGDTNKPKWSIRDTEFLLRLIMCSKIDGADLEVAAEAVKKIKDLHAEIVSHKVSING